MFYIRDTPFSKDDGQENVARRGTYATSSAPRAWMLLANAFVVSG